MGTKYTQRRFASMMRRNVPRFGRQEDEGVIIVGDAARVMEDESNALITEDGTATRVTEGTVT